MGMVHRMKTTSKLPGTEGVVEEAGLVFHRDILSKVQRYSIPNKLILNLGQTSPKEVSVDKTALVKKNFKFVTIAGVSDKRAIAATFTVPCDRIFLLVQLIYGGQYRDYLTPSIPPLFY